MAKSPDLETLQGLTPVTSILSGALPAQSIGWDSVPIRIPLAAEASEDWYVYIMVDPRDQLNENTESNNLIRLERAYRVPYDCENAGGGDTFGTPGG